MFSSSGYCGRKALIGLDGLDYKPEPGLALDKVELQDSVIEGACLSQANAGMTSEDEHSLQMDCLIPLRI